MLRCLLWIVYRAVVIELSEKGLSPICALLRVLDLSMYLCKISPPENLQSSESLGKIIKESSVHYKKLCVVIAATHHLDPLFIPVILTYEIYKM